MRYLKLASGLLAVVAVTVLVVGGAGFSQVSAERGLQVAVVSDDEALIGYDTPNKGETVTDGDTVTLVEVTNRVTSDISVEEVDVSGDEEIQVDTEDYPTDISPGDPAPVKAEITCENTDTEVTDQLEVTVQVSGEAIEAQLYGETRSFELSCEPPIEEQTRVWFSGAGNAKVESSPENPVQITIWKYSNPGQSAENATDSEGELSTETMSVDEGQMILGETNTSRDFTIVAVQIEPDEGQSITYVHHGFNHTSNDLYYPSAGYGDVVEDW